MSWLPSVTTIPPAEEPVTLDELKAFLRVDGTDEDATITALVSAARGLVEQHTGTGLVTQTRSLLCASWDDLASLMVGPVQSVSSVKYLDANEAEQTLSTSVYSVVSSGLRASIRLKAQQTWPPQFSAADAIRVVAVVGYGAAADVPEQIKIAMWLLVSQWFDTRATFTDSRMTELPNVVAALLANHRLY